MIIVGITGGIGSGKTTVARMFEKFGIPVYVSDEEAKKLMVESEVVMNKISELFGKDAYKDGELNKSFIAETIFQDEEKLKQMNAIVHPEVASHFKKWLIFQESPYILKESAILFESGANVGCDLIITVTAPKQIRIDRVVKRDRTSQLKVESIISNQLDDSFKIQNSDYVIHNLDLKDTQIQVEEIHQKILNRLH